MRFLMATDVTRAFQFSRCLTGLVMAGCAGLAGCGKSDALPALKVYEVRGQVVMADGKPLSGGSIYFVSKAGDLPVTPSGVIGPDGKFSITTGGSGEGAPPGEYKVRVEGPPGQSVGKTAKPAVPARYNDEDGSGLIITVRAETNQLDPIRLK
jgi:hypothetical protein